MNRESRSSSSQHHCRRCSSDDYCPTHPENPSTTLKEALTHRLRKHIEMGMEIGDGNGNGNGDGDGDGNGDGKGEGDGAMWTGMVMVMEKEMEWRWGRNDI